MWKGVLKNLVVFCLVIFMISCNKETAEPDKSYSFFVAGHTYGMPGVDNVGLHPPFQQKFDLINNRNISLGFLTGDIVKNSTVKNWDEVDSVLSFLNAEVFYVAGNHDMTDRELFEERYGRTYYSFKKFDDLFIILDPNIDHWNISGEQLNFLEDMLESNEVTNSCNIFVFFHQLLWWERDNKYQYIRMNTREGRADTINFWSAIIPLFCNTGKPVSMFAGDMGAGYWSDNFMYSYEITLNMKFIGSGMGDGDGDNFIIVSVLDNGELEFELIAINGENIDALGELVDYELPVE